MPHLSIVIPVFNREYKIEDCLKSIRKSVYTDYEIIVVDDHSTDSTASVAKKYADKLIEMPVTKGLGYTRNAGFVAMRGDVAVSIDSDVMIMPDTLSKIADFLSSHKEVDAVTGLLSKTHPNNDFFSQYKNLYMNYIFGRLPEIVTFLYGSIHAVRKDSLQSSSLNDLAEDTEHGQLIFLKNKKIAFLKGLEVVHLKKYGLFSFIKNDFWIPFSWAGIFVKYKGWRQLFKYGTGFAHSPKEQLISVILAPAIVMLSFGGALNQIHTHLVLILACIWLLLNLRFLAFLAKEKGMLFGLVSTIVTFFDNIVMAVGIACGLIYTTLSFRKKNNAAG